MCVGWLVCVCVKVEVEAVAGGGGGVGWGKVLEPAGVCEWGVAAAKEGVESSVAGKGSRSRGGECWCRSSS